VHFNTIQLEQTLILTFEVAHDRPRVLLTDTSTRTHTPRSHLHFFLKILLYSRCHSGLAWAPCGACLRGTASECRVMGVSRGSEWGTWQEQTSSSTLCSSQSGPWSIRRRPQPTQRGHTRRLQASQENPPSCRCIEPSETSSGTTFFVGCGGGAMVHAAHIVCRRFKTAQLTADA
jgi:hypothetical protein